MEIEQLQSSVSIGPRTIVKSMRKLSLTYHVGIKNVENL